MALMGMRITSLPVFANLHYNSGVGTFLLRILAGRIAARAVGNPGGALEVEICLQWTHYFCSQGHQGIQLQVQRVRTNLKNHKHY